MIKVTIDEKDYQIKNFWDEITLRKAQELINIPIPDSLKEIYEALLIDDKLKTYHKKQKALAPEQQIKEHPLFFGKTITLLSDIPDEVMEYVDPESRIEIYFNHIEQNYLDIFFGTPNDYKPENIKQFEFKNETFYFPETLKIFDKFIPQYKENALPFTEAADIMIKIGRLKDFGIEAMSEIIAIYCRKKNEQYNEQLVIERSEGFRDLPMNIVWEVFFCIIKLLNTSVKRLNTYISSAGEELKEKTLACGVD